MRALAALLLLLTAGSAGCVSVTPGSALSSAPAERADLGLVGLVLAAYRPATDVGRPPTRLESAGQGAGQGALLMAKAAGSAGQGALLAIGLLPVAMGIGALVGAGLADPVENLAELDRTIQGAVRETDLPAMLREAVMDVARERRDRRIEPLSTAGPATPDERPGYGHLAGHGIDTVLEVGVRRLRLASRPGHHRRVIDSNPPFVLEATGTARLIRMADGAEIAATALAATDGPNEFAAWAKDDAAEIRQGSRRLARSLAEAATVLIGLTALEALPAEHTGDLDGDPTDESRRDESRPEGAPLELCRGDLLWAWPGGSGGRGAPPSRP